MSIYCITILLSLCDIISILDYGMLNYGVSIIYTNSPRARGGLFVLKGPYDLRVPPIVKISQESESARLTKIILSKSTVKTL